MDINFEKIELGYDLIMEKTKLILSRLRKPSKQLFWTWIAYQTIKGTLTTSLIWIPLIWAVFH